MSSPAFRHLLSEMPADEQPIRRLKKKRKRRPPTPLKVAMIRAGVKLCSQKGS